MLSTSPLVWAAALNIIQYLQSPLLAYLIIWIVFFLHFFLVQV